MLITIIVPVYNEKKTIEKVICDINKKVKINKQIIVIDDGSTDGTKEIIEKKLLLQITKTIYHDKNLGKGAAIKSSIPFINGEIIAIQDADLEYDPSDLNKLIEKIISGETNVAYGSRVLNKLRYNKNFISNFRVFGNHMLTLLSNIINNQKLTDAHTCYKVFNSNIFKKLELKENGFAFCAEVNTKLAKLNEKIIELPINYKGRSEIEGKKIKLRDAFGALYAIIKYKYLTHE